MREGSKLSYGFGASLLSDFVGFVLASPAGYAIHHGMAAMAALIRTATLADLEAITTIYNDAILTTTATFDTEPKNLEQQRLWFTGRAAAYPVTVAEDNGKICGWGSLAPWSDRCAYRGTAENSVYVAAKSRGQGVGNLLLGDLIVRAQAAKLHTIIARIADSNPASVALHRRHDFVEIGVMRQVGYKFDAWLDVLMMQRLL